MSLADNDIVKEAQRIADALPAGTSNDDAVSNPESDRADTDPEAAADRVAENWVHAAESLILACAYLLGALNAFASEPERMETFLSRLVAKRVLSENDVLTRLKTNGKLSMLQKIGRHADTLLQPSVLCLLPAHYSIIYQICLLIEEVGDDRAEFELSRHPDATRDDVTKMRAALKPRDTAREPVPSLSALGDSAIQLFALDLNARDLGPFSNEYVELDTLHRCLRHPQAADNAGLVAIVPILKIGTFERALMPLLGFDAPHKLFLVSGVNEPEITDRDVIIVAKRGNFWPQPLTVFPAESGRQDVLTLAELLFPDCMVRCQLFARARAHGWLTFIGEENWNERPSIR